ncbi:MAG: hypothetical protein HY840_06035 [Bacteroidetes bacterium]|nr:hypothetical protein [Bacteroidota bacterium]
MKLIKITLFATFFMAASVVSYAQLSDRQNNPGKFKIGTRPVAGNLGFMIGGSMSDFKTLIKGDSSKNTLPLLALKYYKSDSQVWRLGVKATKNSTVRKGKIDTTGNYLMGLPTSVSKDSVTMTSEFLLYPGIEKHFLSSNIFDAYLAASLPLGFLREKQINNEDIGNTTSDYSHHKMSKMSLIYGIEAFFGIQAFIADLPLALGLEMGVSGIGYRGEKYKHKDEESNLGVATNQTYYTYKDDPMNAKYSSLKSNSYELKGSVRLTLSYYFAK